MFASSLNIGTYAVFPTQLIFAAARAPPPANGECVLCACHIHVFAVVVACARVVFVVLRAACMVYYLVYPQPSDLAQIRASLVS